MTDKMTVYQPITPEVWHTIEGIAPAMFKARLFGVESAEQAMAIMLKGHELGMALTASFEFIDIIKDKPSLKPRGALALIHQCGLCEKVVIDDQVDANGKPSGCAVTMKRKGGIEFTAAFTMADAKLAGLLEVRPNAKGPGGWQKYPANMLRWRAIGFCAAVVFPDVTGGLYQADELGADITPEGDVVDGSWQEAMEPEEQLLTWTSNPNISVDKAATFLNKACQHYGLTDAQVKEALGVSNIMDTTGSLVEAKATIETWVDEQSGPEQEQMI